MKINLLYKCSSLGFSIYIMGSFLLEAEQCGRENTGIRGR